MMGRFIRGVKSAQVMTWLLGLLIFFDDYTNTLVVGNTMRPITDRMRVSREKLSYIVDSTAAPVTTVALISTWVGYQVSLIREGLQEIGSDGGSAYAIFIQSIPYATYSWLAIAFVLMVAIMDRDFGPMLKAERRARHAGQVMREGASPLMDEVAEQLTEGGAPDARAHRAVVPVLVLLLASMVGLYWDGRQQLLAQLGSGGLAGLPLREFFSHADPARALFWAAIAGSITAIVLALAGRSLTLNRAVEAWVGGCKAMMAALIILVLAWSIKDVCSELGTGPVVVDWTTGNLPPHLLPSITFVVAAFIAFSTGTSWASMAILMPIVIPLGHRLPELAHLSAPHAQGILVASIAAVLSGSVWGDHCSPISDTTIMSSMASGSDHIDHVRTQIPYALSAGALTVLLGTLPAGFSISPWISLPTALLAVVLLVRFLGKPAGEPS
jgi:Na+/H+ antiporter NhaC